MRPTLPCAHLRVYQPLSSFPAEERETIESALRAGGSRGSRWEGRVLQLVAPEESREAYEKMVDGVRHVCPARNRLRTLIALVTSEHRLPYRHAQTLFPRARVEEARRELEQMQEAGKDLRPFLLQSPWHVPLRWFLCFTDSERRLEAEDDHPRIRYETSIGSAKSRLERAYGVLQGAGLHPSYSGMVGELSEWLGTFDEGLLELDYASVSRLTAPDELADDHSAADLEGAVAALAEGDPFGAGPHYQRANERRLRCCAREAAN